MTRSLILLSVLCSCATTIDPASRRVGQSEVLRSLYAEAIAGRSVVLCDTSGAACVVMAPRARAP